MASAGELKGLNVARRRCKAQLTMFSKFLERLDVSGGLGAEKIGQIIERLDKLEGTFERFGTIQSELEPHADDYDDELAERDDFENRYFELKFSRDPALREEYCGFMREYSSLRHMTRVLDEDDRVSYYMPHHPVIKAERCTTKLRVVFDCSMPSSTGKSLNDLQIVGPVIQSDLFDILIRFREFRFVVSADIAKMYRQEFVEPTQHSVEEGIRMCYRVSAALAGGGFKLRKWLSNEPAILRAVSQGNEDFQVLDFHGDHRAKILGLTWHCSSDVLFYKIQAFDTNVKVTKRTILSRLWQEGLSWDESVPAHLHTAWTKFRSELPNLNGTHIDRHISCVDALCHELHGFSDASEDAYGGAVYVRSIDTNGDITVRLLCAKSRVGVLVRLNYRLELAKNVSQQPKGLRKRAGITNPIAYNEFELMESSLWWHGPSFLQSRESHWPRASEGPKEVPEVRVLKGVVVFVAIGDYFFERYSDFNRLSRIVAYVLRFVDGEGIMSVGGRLRNSPYQFDKKHPMLLSPKHRLTRMLCEHEHKRLLHGGPQLLLASLREKYWAVAARNLIRAVVRSCVTCSRFNPQYLAPIMGDLPPSLLTGGSVFSIVGVDYMGSVNIRDKKGRGSRLPKCYESSKLANSYAQEGVQWHFIPPQSPHFGGLWEPGSSRDKDVKINVKDGQQYKALTKTLCEKGYSWHSYENKQNRPIKVMAVNLHHSCFPEEIVKDMRGRDYKLLEATKKLKYKTKQPSNMFMLSFRND
ncbi:uncharacterized protein [Euwallacea fornicatus]|uniref:uncharacterized protein n=1 Tax=Euwallacea fornicatus TaxID=995702 RepID=UPI00338FE47D